MCVYKITMKIEILQWIIPVYVDNKHQSLFNITDRCFVTV